MAQTEPPPHDPAPTTLQIDAVCDAFEAEWIAGRRPEIETYLSQVHEGQRQALFAELLPLELDYRRRAGEPPDREQYQARFTALASIVAAQFDALQTRSDSLADVRLADSSPLFPRRMGDYELLGVLGRGGMGEVYRARHVHLDRVVALKILPEHSLCDSQAISRFKQERKLLARLDHAHIVRALDAREERGKYMLAMEHVEGVSLDRLATTQQRLGIAEACELTRQAADGLQYAYEHGLTHRDIKPSNLILSTSGVLKILDFGLARTTLSELADDLDHRTTSPLGTLDYMAPEQFDDAHRVDTRADVYSLGCTLFQLICGSAPYSSESRSLLGKMKAHCMAPIPSPRERRADVPTELERILQRMLAKHPQDRYATPGEVAAALAPFARGARLSPLVEGGKSPSVLASQQAVETPRGQAETNVYAGSPANVQPDGEANNQQTFIESEGSTLRKRTIGDFDLLSRIGAGGMGVVYRAWQRSLDRQVALKCVARTGDRQSESRFAREIRTLGRIEHPNLVKIYTSGSDDDRLYYAMELVEGATLSSVCQKLQANTSSTADVNLQVWRSSLSTACLETRTAEQPVSGSIPAAPQRSVEGLSEPGRQRLASESYVRNIVNLIRQAADAAHALHEAGAIHRDIKPGNIMVTGDGSQAVLMDLGLVQLADEVDGSVTRTTQFVGTLRYASPEQLLGRAMQIDRRTDVYSLGVTLWELLTLRPLYGADEQTSTPELIQRIQGEEPEPIRKYYPAVDRDLEAIVLKCLEKARGARYATAAELSTDLGCWLRGERPQGVRSSSLIAWRKFAARHKRRATIGAALAAMLAATAMLTAHFAGRGETLAAPARGMVEQLPGLSGQWWFEETPWLVPAVRGAAGDALDDPKFFVAASTSDAHAKPLDLNDRDVATIYKKLRSAVDRTPQTVDPLVVELEELSADSLDGEKLAERLRDILETAQQETRDRTPRAEDLHLQAALENRIALTTGDQDAAGRADELYRKALGLYGKDSPLYALCLGDYARLNSGITDNYSLAIKQFDELLQIKDASPTATVANLCAQAETYNAQDNYLSANNVYEKALERAKKNLGDGHPLTGYVHKSYGWNLLDHWMVEKARTHFKKSQDIQSGNSDLGNPLAKIEYFHARHGYALADRYSGLAELARTSYGHLIEEIRAEIKLDEHDTGVKRLLHQRLYNSLERCADSTLYEKPIPAGAADELLLQQACLNYAEARLEAAEPANNVAMTYKWIIAMALTSDKALHKQARDEYQSIGKDVDVGGGFDKERVNLLGRVAAAVLLRAEGAAEARTALQSVIAFAQSDPKRKTRRESLELQLLCAEILLAMPGSDEEVAQSRAAMQQLIISFPSQKQMKPFLQRYRDLVGAASAQKPAAAVRSNDETSDGDSQQN